MRKYKHFLNKNTYKNHVQAALKAELARVYFEEFARFV